MAISNRPVLVVEDDPLQAAMIKAAIQYFDPPANLMHASDGFQAIQKMSRVRPSAVIADVNMPIMNGVSLLKLMKQDPVFADVPTLLLTAMTRDEIDGLEELEGVSVVHKGTCDWGEVGSFAKSGRLACHVAEAPQAGMTKPARRFFPSEQQGAFLDALKSMQGFTTDEEISKWLGLSPSRVSRIRSGKLGVSDSIIMRVHEKTGIDIDGIRAMVEQL